MPLQHERLLVMVNPMKLYLDLQDFLLFLLELHGLLAVLCQQLCVGVNLVLQVVVQLLHLLIQQVELLLNPVGGHLQQTVIQ